MTTPRGIKAWLVEDRSVPVITLSFSFDDLVRGLQPPPLSPDESMATIAIPAGFQLELVAAEPLVVDPVMVAKGGQRPNESAAREVLEEALKSGKAYSKFLEIVSLQGGDTEAVDQGLPLAAKKVPFLANKKGTIRAMNGERIGFALIELGGGRRKTSDKVDPRVGFWFEKGIGEE